MNRQRADDAITDRGSWDRRRFLTHAAGVAALASAAVAATPSVWAGKPAGWKTAIGLNGFQSGAHKYRKNYPLWEVLDFAARTGFDGVELVGDWPQGGYPEAGETDRIRALRRLYDNFGLRIFSLQLGADGAFAPQEATRAEWVAMVRGRLALAKQLGCACMGFWPGGGLRGQTMNEAFRHLGESFREVARQAEDVGILTAFEIEPPFIFNSEEHVHRILEETRHPNLKAIYDPSHYDLMNGSTGRPHEMLARVGVQNIGYLHLTDTDGTLRDGGTSKHLAPGDGHAHLEESLRWLRENGFRGWMMIDAWEVPDPYDACRKGLRMIREGGR